MVASPRWLKRYPTAPLWKRMWMLFRATIGSAAATRKLGRPMNAWMCVMSPQK